MVVTAISQAHTCLILALLILLLQAAATIRVQSTVYLLSMASGPCISVNPNPSAGISAERLSTEVPALSQMVDHSRPRAICRDTKKREGAKTLEHNAICAANTSPERRHAIRMSTRANANTTGEKADINPNTWMQRTRKNERPLRGGVVIDSPRPDLKSALWRVPIMH